MAATNTGRGFKLTNGDATGKQLAVLVPTDYRVLHFASSADSETDWNVANPTHPTLYIHSETTPATDYVSVDHDGTDGTINVAGGNLKLAIAGTDMVTLQATNTQGALKFSATLDAPNMDDGYGMFEVDTTITGTAGAGSFPASAASAWVNIPSGTVGAGKYVCARNDGIYEASGATITNAKLIFGARMHYIASDTDGLRFPFSLNTNNAAITALFDCNNISDFGTVANAGSSASTLLPFLRTASGTVKYVLLYDQQ